MTRIIAGAAGSLQLRVPPRGTRPTSDRVREAIFSALDSWNLLDAACVIDLYAGSGALGLEALSRGAAQVTLVEKNATAAAICQQNAARVREACGDAAGQVSVARQSVQAFLQGVQQSTVQGTLEDGLQGAEQPGAHVIFIDPPYDLPESALAADLELAAALLDAAGVIIVERSSRSPEPQWGAGLQLLRQKKYGETTLWFAERAS